MIQNNIIFYKSYYLYVKLMTYLLWCFLLLILFYLCLYLLKFYNFFFSQNKIFIQIFWMTCVIWYTKYFLNFFLKNYGLKYFPQLLKFWFLYACNTWFCMVPVKLGKKLKCFPFHATHVTVNIGFSLVHFHLFPFPITQNSLQSRQKFL